MSFKWECWGDLQCKDFTSGRNVFSGPKTHFTEIPHHQFDENFHYIIINKFYSALSYATAVQLNRFEAAFVCSDDNDVLACAGLDFVPQAQGFQ